MQRVLSGIIVILILVLGRKAYGFYTKYQHAKGLKFDIGEYDLPNGFNLHNIVEPLEVHIEQIARNFSTSTFNIQSINIDVFSPDNDKEPIAEQIKPVQPFKVEPNGIKTFSMSFQIAVQEIKKLVKKSGGTLKVGTNFLLTGKYGIPIHIIGFVEADGVTVPIDDKLTI